MDLVLTGRSRSYAKATMHIKHFTILWVVLGLIPAVADASPIYNNGAPVFIGGNISQVRSADDFVLASSANVTAVRFFASVFPGNTFSTNFSGDIAWEIYNDSAGSIGTVVSSGAVTGLVGSASGSFFQLDFDLGSTLALSAGTYWLELHEGATLSS